MTDLTSLVSAYGWQAAAVAVLLWVLLRSDIRIHYPARKNKADD